MACNQNAVNQIFPSRICKFIPVGQPKTDSIYLGSKNGLNASQVTSCKSTFNHQEKIRIP